VAGRRNFFSHGELPLVLLALVGRGPIHGYDLMHELARLLAPAYEPSPGSVYPALAALVEEGLVVANAGEGRRRTYRITRKGRELLASRRSAVRAFEVRTGARLGGDDDVRAAIERFEARVGAFAERLPVEAVADALERTADELEAMSAAQAGRRRSGR
jgi:DNA-binding PadR family transcriptional regulator